jgi:LCP family protein required for cell wall assembly
MCALVGIVAGYVITLIYRPNLLPPILRFGGLTTPTTVLLLGTDVVYSREHRGIKADAGSFQGRSDTILVAHLDPIRNSFCVLSIPRDTQVKIPGYRGVQKINGANALGGPRLVMDTIESFLGIHIDHYVVLNVQGLVDLVDELGGITVEIPKRMRYVDHSAKLNIDLQPGPHLLSGREAMGFVRFRHDELGDIGRVQRQELFLRAVQQKALDPMSWAKVPKLLSIAQSYVLTDMNTAQLMQLATFARAVPKDNQQMVLLPGHFTGTGDWGVDDADVQTVVSRLLGQPGGAATREAIKVTVENASSNPEGARKLYKYLSGCGYNVVAYRSKPEAFGGPLSTTRIIAQCGNTEDALLVKRDLLNHGDIVNASVGDIQSAITVVAGDDVSTLVSEPSPTQPSTGNGRRHRGHRRQ